MRLIDADALKRDLESVTLSNGTLVNANTILALLDKYPTAYDLDKVADQLEELKAIKDGGIPIIHGQEELKLHDREIRNKAINDFAKWLESKKYLMKEIQEHDFCYTHYDELKADYVKTEFFAEQLKAGDCD